MSRPKIKELKSKLDRCNSLDRVSLIWMWSRQQVIDFKQFQILVAAYAEDFKNCLET